MNPVFRHAGKIFYIFGILHLSNVFMATAIHGALTPVYPAGEVPLDHRLEPLKDLNGYFPMAVPSSTEDWNQRAEALRKQILVATGLWPMPSALPMNPVIHGRIEESDYSVEKVYFEAFPGLYVTGNLYRPRNKTGPFPGILCPHGHWNEGRFHDNGSVRNEIAEGGERFLEGGRSPLQARCVHLARMGCIVFHYDMLGYADSTQISYDLAHRFAEQRAEMNDENNWGLFSPQAESRLQSVFGIQTYHSVRSLDFLLSMPEVDSSRIAITGASGGGTQTFILAGIDPRIQVSIPAVMVSTSMQGGCTCENATLLRVNTGNIEFAGLFAPKPQGMTAANDWTKEMESKGFPELKKLYSLYGAENQVALFPRIHFGHNYNSVSRGFLYRWINTHFNLGYSEPILEEDYRYLTRKELSVWDEKHPTPASGEELERSVLRWMDKDATQQILCASENPEHFQTLVGEGIRTIIGRTLSEVGPVEWILVNKQDRGDWIEMSGKIRAPKQKEELPAVFLYPKQWNQDVTIWVSSEGKQGLLGDDGNVRPEVRRLLDQGQTVVGVDLIGQGEFLKPGESDAPTRKVENGRHAAGYTFGYNHSLFSQRTHDIVSLVSYLLHHEKKVGKVNVVGVDGSAAWVLAAKAVCGKSIHRVAVDTRGFRFSKISDLQDPNFLPGGAKYGDLPGLIALAAPDPLWVAGECDGDVEMAQRLYRRHDAVNRFSVLPRGEDNPSDQAVTWLLQTR